MESLEKTDTFEQELENLLNSIAKRGTVLKPTRQCGRKDEVLGLLGTDLRPLLTASLLCHASFYVEYARGKTPDPFWIFVCDEFIYRMKVQFGHEAKAVCDDYIVIGERIRDTKKTS